MKYLDGQSLPSVWIPFTDEEKLAAAQEVGGIILEISEFTFDRIGGLTLTQEIGPTVEGCSQDKLHSPDCYDVGPYDSTHGHALDCYEKELYYYTHANDSDVNEGLFDLVPRDEVIKSLKETRNRLASSSS